MKYCDLCLRRRYDTTDFSTRLSGAFCTWGLAANVVPGELVPPSLALVEPAYGVIPASPEISAWVTAGQERFAAAPKINWNPAAVPPVADHIRPFPITYTTSACPVATTKNPKAARVSCYHVVETQAM